MGTVNTQPTDRPDLPLQQVRKAAERSRAAGPWSIDHLWICWIVLLAAGAVLALVVGLVAGGTALAGVAVGIGIVGLFFTISTLVIAAVGARHPKAVLGAALAAYLVKIVALGVVIVLFPADGPVSPRWMAIAVVIGLLCWLGAHLRYVWTAKLFYVDPG
jgi:ATP synthase protein I